MRFDLVGERQAGDVATNSGKEKSANVHQNAALTQGAETGMASKSP